MPRARFRRMILTPVACLWAALGEALYPALCLSCERPVSSRNEYLCRACLAKFKNVDVWDLPYRALQERLEAGMVDIVVPFYGERAGPLQCALTRLKKEGAGRLGVFLGEELGRSVLDAGYGEVDAVVPVPLHRCVMRERSFNQVDSVARGIGRVTGRPVRARWVCRTRYTRVQAALPWDARPANVHRAFAVPALARRAIQGKKILLVDDIVASGSTICACASALLEAGAAKVVGCAVAIACENAKGRIS